MGLNSGAFQLWVKVIQLAPPHTARFRGRVVRVTRGVHLRVVAPHCSAAGRI
jgi:hypothetical protein